VSKSPCDNAIVSAPSHDALIAAFHAIQDKAAIGWAALDTKFERFAIAAIAAAMNRSGDRVAHLEYPPRRDLVVLEAPLRRRAHRPLDHDQGRIRVRYEAKAGQLFDFAPQQGTTPEYLGGQLNIDLAKRGPEKVSGLFFISDPDDPTRHLKYFKGHRGQLDDAVHILRRNVTHGCFVTRETIDCGIVDGTPMRIHMVVFDQIPAPAQDASEPDLDAFLTQLLAE
jgi:hypothetical protein